MALRYLLRLRIAILILVISAHNLVLAAETYSDHEAYCNKLSFEACGEKFKKVLANSKPFSVDWYKVSSYQLDYFYDHQLFEQTLVVTTKLLEQNTLPSVFKAQVYFYHTKALNYVGQKKLAKEYALKTKSLLREHFDAFQDPYRIIEVANLYHVFGDGETAVTLLLKAEKHFAHRQDPLFNFEMYGNLAQAYIAVGEQEKQRDAWLKALHYAKQTNDSHKIKIAYGGLAFYQKTNSDYQGAYDSYIAALAVKAPEKSHGSFIRLQINLAEMSLKLGNKSLAQSHFDQIMPELVSKLYLPRFNQLAKELATY